MKRSLKLYGEKLTRNWRAGCLPGQDTVKLGSVLLVKFSRWFATAIIRMVEGLSAFFEGGWVSRADICKNPAASAFENETLAFSVSLQELSTFAAQPHPQVQVEHAGNSKYCSVTRIPW